MTMFSLKLETSFAFAKMQTWHSTLTGRLSKGWLDVLLFLREPDNLRKTSDKCPNFMEYNYR